MSWWDVGGGSDDVIGDQPADLMADALDTIATERAESNRAKPTLQESLDGFAAALRKLSDAREEGEQVANLQLKAELDNGSTVSAGQQADEQIVATFANAITEIRARYEERWERQPRLRELLETLAFILRAHAQEYLSDVNENKITQLVAD